MVPFSRRAWFGWFSGRYNFCAIYSTPGPYTTTFLAVSSVDCFRVIMKSADSRSIIFVRSGCNTTHFALYSSMYSLKAVSSTPLSCMVEVIRIIFRCSSYSMSSSPPSREPTSGLSSSFSSSLKDTHPTFFLLFSSPSSFFFLSSSSPFAAASAFFFLLFPNIPNPNFFPVSSFFSLESSVSIKSAFLDSSVTTGLNWIR
mmetsp:Transcript_18346/g.34289  ORF Transcript_18346/g.34289 Transcript_18346/m.34289 type:complete len:200 (-) Transcript_18346:1788-2387(-)